MTFSVCLYPTDVIIDYSVYLLHLWGGNNILGDDHIAHMLTKTNKISTQKLYAKYQ